MDVQGPSNPRHAEILLTIGRWYQKYGVPPTVREIAEDAAISSSSVASYNIRRLAVQGYLTMSTEANFSRGLRLTPAGEAWLASQGLVTPRWAAQLVHDAASLVVEDPTPERLGELAAVLDLAAA